MEDKQDKTEPTPVETWGHADIYEQIAGILSSARDALRPGKVLTGTGKFKLSTALEDAARLVGTGLANATVTEWPVPQDPK